ncbi:MAG: 6,7-dimethyl-8-ribityllumazine synthase [Candidatus Eremiobacteraeota bacterium]|nr:6,7-dimethyl-8-ribityllumazine synthase [Candidatus Eremiobacteraeota bacterium]
MKVAEHDRKPLPDGRSHRVAVVSAAFYSTLAAWLEDGARRALDACNVAPKARTFLRVAGCFELPLAAARLIDTGRFDAVVALGVVVRGETPHFDYVAGECARGIMDVQLTTRIPVGFGVLTTDTLAQAEERADPARGDKGFSATLAAVGMCAELPPAGARVASRDNSEAHSQPPSA